MESPKSRASQLPWWTALLTATCVVLGFVFHGRWTRPISFWPLHLPLRRYTFVEHPGLRDFDDASAARRWERQVREPGPWWDTEWRDDAGGRFPRGIDVFHKMHCIIAIREEFSLYLTDDAKAATEVEAAERKKAAAGGKGLVNNNHLQHCFDFLRQDILCAADLTLEPLGPGYVETDGQGVVHECKDWRVLLQHVGVEDIDQVELK